MKIVAISSGKGGVGKTTVTCQLALALADQDKKILIVDGDLGLANIDIHFGVRPISHIGDVLTGKSIASCITPLLTNVDLIAGGSGLVELTRLNAFQRREIINQVQDLQFQYDIALIDTASGIYDHVLHLNAIADECIVVVTPDPSSFADAYALIKVLHQKYKLQNFKILFNHLRSNNGAHLFVKFSEVVEKFLSVRLSYAGGLMYDEQIIKAQQQQRLIMRQNYESLTQQIFKHMAVDLLDQEEFNSYSNRKAIQNVGLEAIFRPASGHA